MRMCIASNGHWVPKRGARGRDFFFSFTYQFLPCCDVHDHKQIFAVRLAIQEMRLAYKLANCPSLHSHINQTSNTAGTGRRIWTERKSAHTTIDTEKKKDMQPSTDSTKHSSHYKWAWENSRYDNERRELIAPTAQLVPGFAKSSALPSFQTNDQTERNATNIFIINKSSSSIGNNNNSFEIDTRYATRWTVSSDTHSSPRKGSLQTHSHSFPTRRPRQRTRNNDGFLANARYR